MSQAPAYVFPANWHTDSFVYAGTTYSRGTPVLVATQGTLDALKQAAAAAGVPIALVTSGTADTTHKTPQTGR
jgi:hypothetical protein